jgi:hypothetical protein
MPSSRTRAPANWRAMWVLMLFLGLAAVAVSDESVQRDIPDPPSSRLSSTIPLLEAPIAWVGACPISPQFGGRPGACSSPR